ncbi:MAG: SLATT domain-containing protein [Symploca sp. SIO2E9]|nr:SLATT domain-containing protein [Symploca sp. SIO2E9]
MLKNIENEFERHLVDCHDSKQAHFDLADYYHEKANLIYYAQSFGLASITAWLLTSQYDGLLPLDHPAVKVTPTVLSVIVSILTILEQVFRFKEKAMIHELAGKRYHVLWRTCKNWRTDFPDESTIQQARFAVQTYREQLNEINREAPHLSSIMWKKIYKIRKRKNYKDVSKYSFEDQDSNEK